MTKILAISGRKQAGKDTCFKFLDQIVPGVQQFYFAEPLKRMCVDVLGCPEELVFGTDQQKNTLVPHLLWENFPVLVWSSRTGDGPPNLLIGQPNWSLDSNKRFPTLPGSPGQPDRYAIHNGEWYERKSGPMTVREVLQYWGTEIFRHAYHNVWADACIRSIQKSGCDLAVITDCRFPNEVDAVHGAGGKVVRLTRIVVPDDYHVSEVSLDQDRYDWSNFDLVLDNAQMSIETQSLSLYDVLLSWGWVPHADIGPLTRAARNVADQ